jgi:hypothetical protein
MFIMVFRHWMCSGASELIEAPSAIEEIMMLAALVITKFLCSGLMISEWRLIARDLAFTIPPVVEEFILTSLKIHNRP